MTEKDFYKILGVSKSASEDEIKKAYREKARKFHPDLNPGNSSAEVEFKKIQEAYDILSDSQKRKQFDQFGSAAFEAGGAGPGGFQYQWGNQPGGGGGGYQNIDFDFSGSGFEDILGGIFGGRKGKQFRDRSTSTNFPGEDIESEITIDFQTAVNGGKRDLAIDRGKGSRSTLEVTIPAGVQDGAKLKLSGKGAASFAGGPPGDLILMVRVSPDPMFTRKGYDIYSDAAISVDQAVLGAETEVKTIDGNITITIPPGTSSGQKLRLRNKGGRHPKGDKRGDHYAVIKIVVPKKVDEESKRLIEEFAKRNPIDSIIRETS